MKKVIMAVSALLIAVPVGMTADELLTLEVEKAVPVIQRNDLSTQISATKPELSDDTQPYQSEFSDELEKIQPVNEEIQDKNTAWSAEWSAYQSLYNYWMINESLKLSEANLNQAKNELHTVEKRQANGLASDMDMIQAEMKVNNAEVSYLDSVQQSKVVKAQLNQKLNREFEDDILVEVPEFKKLATWEYDAERIYNAVKDDHASLAVLQTSKEVYEEIVDKTDTLSVLGGSDMEDTIESLDEQEEDLARELRALQSLKASLEAKLEAAMSGTLTKEDGSPYTSGELTLVIRETNNSISKLDIQLNQMMQQIMSLSAQRQGYEESIEDGEDHLDDAKEELAVYYNNELETTNIRIKQQQQMLEFLSFQYEERVKTLHTKLDLYEDNIKQAELLYEKNKKMFDVGMATQDQIESTRLNAMNSKLQLLSAQQEYQLLKEELRLFKEGYIAR